MSSISRVFLSNFAVMRIPLATSTHKFSTISKIECPQKQSSIVEHRNHDSRKMRNVRGCVPHEDGRLTQNFTKKLLMNRNIDELQKCELNCIGI